MHSVCFWTMIDMLTAEFLAPADIICAHGFIFIVDVLMQR